MSTLILSRKSVRELLKMPDVINAVEEAFRHWSEGKVVMPPKSYLILEQGDFRAMPVAVPGALGIKWVSVFTENPLRRLPTVIGTIIYNDPATGSPLAIMDATDLTAYRTGATSALASRYLARRNSSTLGIVGAGAQAYTQLLAHAEVFDLKSIRVYDYSREAAEKFAGSLNEYPLRTTSLQEAIDCDIVCTLTPSRQPFVKKEWVRPGTHINAVGADARGKQELEPSVLAAATVVVDDIVQAASAGELNMPISKGLFREEDIYATLSDVISGKKNGRNDDAAVTVFDCTGLAIEDIAVARLVYESAVSNGRYPSVDLLEA
ncbi:MAG: ornithine cyclodeaminase family protein [Dehalococcoidia bacterium]|nr:ornithine cyclodeaminase family protein [Dehalococcoidia bacterium]